MPRVAELGPAGEFDFAGALARLGSLRGLVALDSADFGGAQLQGVWDRDANEAWIAFEPRVDLTGDRRARAAFDAAERVRTEGRAPGSFQGGFLGAIAYDQGVEPDRRPGPFEDLGTRTQARQPKLPRLPADPLGAPRLMGGLYTNFIHLQRGGVASLVIDGAAPGAESLEARVRAALGGPRPELVPITSVGPLQRLTDATEHRARIEVLRERIAAGELYQANLTHRSILPCQGDPLALYLRLRQTNPAPYMGFLNFAGGAVVSSSPELLLDFEPGALGGSARTQPIKGTAPRSEDPLRDARLAAELVRSEKDRAELAMIVDLARNDLGRWARAGGLSVGEFPVRRSFARVHHLLCDVNARLVPDARAADVFAALFPGGSISGAPKLAALEAIAELEGEGRGAFTGSMGFVSSCGRSRFNILIRTWIHRAGSDATPDCLSLSVGGGITFDSDAELEEQETQHKARALLEALGLDRGATR